MNTMRAIAKLDDKTDTIKMIDAPIPEVGDHELLIRVRAIGVGIHDGYFFPQSMRYPYPIGIEAAGIIESLGSKISKYKIGEQVAFISSMQPKGGTWAEYAVVDEKSLIIRIPDGISFTEAAAIPVAWSTALKSFHALQLKPGESLFIAGASGAIGSFAIQYATSLGCLVAGSASAKNQDYMRSLGATKVVDYSDLHWTDQIKEWMPNGVDAALAIQPGTTKPCLPIIKDNGRIIAVSGDQVNAERGVKIYQVPHDIDISQDLESLMKQIANKKVRLEIEKVYSFQDSLEALKKVQTRHARGKIVITIEANSST